MTINDFFISDNSYQIDWEFVWNLPHFCEMKNTQQSPRWHMEGTAFDHTIQTVDNMTIFVIEESDCRTLHECRLLMLSALFHDIGKPSTTFLGEKDNQWHSYGHDVVGSRIVREMLWDWDIYDREYIAHMVRYHMEPLFFLKSKDPVASVNKITQILPYRDIYLLKMADLEASVQDPQYSTKDADREIVAKFYEIGKELNNVSWLSCLKHFPERMNPEINNWVGCSGSLRATNPYVNDDTLVDIHVMIGLPGSGKNTYIDYLKEKTPINKKGNLVELSRDDIRVELGYCSEGEKIVGTDKQERKVTEVFNKRLREAIANKCPIIINNINLSEKRRKQLKNDAGNGNIRWNYWYIEAPTLEDNLRRRKGQISKKVFMDMISRFDFPQPHEYHNLTIVKQKKYE